MSPEAQVFLSGAASFGVPLLFALNELRLLRKPWHRPDDRERTPDPVVPPLTPGDRPALKPLPPSLIPTLTPQGTPARSRELELV